MNHHEPMENSSSICLGVYGLGDSKTNKKSRVGAIKVLCG